MKVRVSVRGVRRRRRRSTTLRVLRSVLLLTAVLSIGYCFWVFSDAWLSQHREEQAFEEKTAEPAPAIAQATPQRPPVRGEIAPDRQPEPASVLGRISIPRLKTRAMVKEGVDSKTLRRGVGHIPGTALPGRMGNVALAGHRDTFFRSLKDIRKEDRIVLETLEGSFTYAVESLRIVGPDDVEVLKASGHKQLTLVTCYPFYFVGNAPRRFIVQARQVSVTPRSLPGS